MADTQVVINECWRSIDGFINYQVSNIGRVRHANNGNILLVCERDGYKLAILRRGNIVKCMPIHKLVANEFLEKMIPS